MPSLASGTHRPYVEYSKPETHRTSSHESPLPLPPVGGGAVRHEWEYDEPMEQQRVAPLPAPRPESPSNCCSNRHFGSTYQIDCRRTARPGRNDSSWLDRSKTPSRQKAGCGTRDALSRSSPGSRSAILSFSLVNTLISGQTWIACARADAADDTTTSAAEMIRRTRHRASGWWPAFWMTTRIFFAAASSVVCAV
jgi:hypothetical protein